VPSLRTNDDGAPLGSDEVLAVRAAGGARDAFEELVARYGMLVVSVLERTVRDHHRALDLAQEVWIKVHRALDRFRPEKRFRPWLFTIAFNVARDAQRHEGRRPVDSLEEAPLGAAALQVEDLTRAHDERSAIETALAAVDEPFRSALQLVDVLELSYEEAARASECALGTMKSRVSRGRSVFRERYLALTGAAGTTGRQRSMKR